MSEFKDITPEVNAFKKVCNELFSLFEEKNRRYKGSFSEQFKEFGITSSIIRLSDKLNRLKFLAKDCKDCGDESIEDTLKDLAKYAILTLMELSKSEEEN